MRRCDGRVHALSLYSGIGGIDLAAAWAGIAVVAHCEADPFCRSILEKNFPGVPCFDNDEAITKETLAEKGVSHVDLIFGGPPCQPHSVAGKQLHEADPRYRWPIMARLIGQLAPRWVVLENVGGFRRVAEQTVLPDLAAMGYDTAAYRLPAGGVGAPHRRDRIFLVAHLANANRTVRQQPNAEQSRKTTPCPAAACQARLADTHGRGRGSGHGAEPAPTEEPGPQRRRHSQDVGDADGERREQRPKQDVQQAARLAASPGRDTQRSPSRLVDAAECRPQERKQTEKEAERRSPRRDPGRPPQPGLGRDPHGLPRRLDPPRWPSPRNAPQQAWEPPRTTTKKEHRRARLKALGNACVPYQVFPILSMIGTEWVQDA